MNQLAVLNQIETYSDFRMPLKDGSLFTLKNSDLNMYKHVYSKIDVEGELKVMVAWLLSNPSKRKTMRGILRFVNGWLSRSKPAQAQPATTSQREYAASTTIQERVSDLSWADGL